MNLMLACPQFSEALRLEENRLHTFVFENPTVCRAFLADILHQKAGGCGEIVLSEAFEPIPMQKYAEILLEPLTVQPNTRPILTKLYAQLEQVANDEVHFVQYADLQRAVSSFLLTLTESQETELSFSESMVLSQVFKAADLQFDCSAERPIAERLLDYMIAARTYLGTKLFVFYNLKSLLSEDELKMLCKELFYRKIQILLVQSEEKYRLPYEVQWILDDDLCEIY